mmetsp:Transcript_27582/g.65718  ORF Transcript_27582/g.65718 Transcript_27582/m.65718 type:complete len:158 (+) Transcript_27582:252-725(+)
MLLVLLKVNEITNSKSRFIKKNTSWKKNWKCFEKVKKNMYRKNKNIQHIFEQGIKNAETFKERKKESVFIFTNLIFHLSVGTFFLFFGFFSATSAITIIGSVADWDPLAAAVMLCWVEFFTKNFYNYKKITLLIKLINTFKIGISLGIFVDAFKLTG